MKIHKTAIVGKGAQIDETAIIGPYCIIGPQVKIGKDVKLHAHVNIDGDTLIGEGCDIFPFASIGTQPQDLKYAGENSRVIIGKNNVIREYSTVNAGTKLGNMETVIGDNCLLMISTHVAHDCVVGDNVILANNATLGGHVEVADKVIIGGLAAVHQHVKIGCHAIIGGMSTVVNNVPPFASISGERAKIVGVNLIGMKRSNFERQIIQEVQALYDNIFFKSNEDVFQQKIKLAKEKFSSAAATDILRFIESVDNRGLCQVENKK
jgi:UDP-N-acetylglucosamine acyltransferase